MFRRPLRILVPALLCLLAAFELAHAVIKVLTPLNTYVGLSKYIFVAKVEKYFPEKPALILNIQDDLKGKAPYRRLPVTIKVDSKAANENFIPPILKRLSVDQEIVFFVLERGKQSTAFGFTNGSWFQMLGQQVDENRREWSLESGEPYLRRTFRGTTAELRAIIVDALANKKKPPEPDAKEKPGFGPEPEKKGAANRKGGPLFAVIPTLGLGAPIAILAMLFPALFGGVLVLFRQWIAFITVLSVNSTLLLVVMWFGQPFRGSWWGSEAALWFVMTMVSLGGTLWAWRRQMRSVFLPAGFAEAPRRTENVVLLVTSVACMATTLVSFFVVRPSLYDVSWNLMLVFSVGVLFGTAIRLAQTILWADAIPQTRSTEGLILGAVLLASICIAAARDNQGQIVAGPIDDAGNVPRPEPPTRRWAFAVPSTGVVLSVPLVHEDKVYIGVAHPTPKWGTLFCLNRDTGEMAWEFTDDDRLQECYSSPVHYEGRLYFGEGFHWSKNCKVYCIDAATGKKIWDHQTTSQTEATPVVVNGKVYIGAGNQGYLCLDAKDGRTMWQFDSSRIPDPTGKAQDKIFRFGAGPAVAGKRVYFGSGVDRDDRANSITRLFCVDADTGNMVWQYPDPETQSEIKLPPCWATPVVKGDRVYFSLGNGDITMDADHEPPAGAAICLYSITGRKAWEFRINNSILEAPAVDHHHVYVGTRDRHCYCLDRFEGTERWRRDMESVVIATPALARSTTCDQTASVITVGANGKICCLDPNTGAVQWTYDLTAQSPFVGNPSVLVGHTPEGDRRQIFLGAALGGAARLEGNVVVYCLEDIIKAR